MILVKFNYLAKLASLAALCISIFSSLTLQTQAIGKNQTQTAIVNSSSLVSEIPMPGSSRRICPQAERLILRADTNKGDVVFICGVNNVPKTYFEITASSDGENEEIILPIKHFNSKGFTATTNTGPYKGETYYLGFIKSQRYLVVTEGNRIIFQDKVLQWEQCGSNNLSPIAQQQCRTR